MACCLMRSASAVIYHVCATTRSKAWLAGVPCTSYIMDCSLTLTGCILFLAFWIGMIVIGAIAFTIGQPKRLGMCEIKGKLD